jgi:hypothetical protein
MSHRNRGQNLSEWADLVGASLPESVESAGGFDDRDTGTLDDRDDAKPRADIRWMSDRSG